MAATEGGEHFRASWAALRGGGGEFSRHDTALGLSAAEREGLAAAEGVKAAAEEWALDIVAAIDEARGVGIGYRGRPHWGEFDGESVAVEVDGAGIWRW